MDFTMPSELQALKDLTREFVEKELMPYEEEAERNNGLPPEIERKLRQKAVALGLNALTMPEEVGGQGLGTFADVLVTEETSKVTGGLSSAIPHPYNILMACNAEQRERFLIPCVRGEKQDCFALTEPDAGSDAASIRTRAVKKGDRWVLNGRKHFISHGDTADFAILFAVTNPGSKVDHVTAFLVERGFEGFSVGRVHETMGHRGYRQAELVFEDCEVPAENVLGEVGKGFELARHWLRNGRIMTAARCIGPAERVLSLAREWAMARVQFGNPISEYQGIQFMLADSATELFAARMMTYNAAWCEDQGEHPKIMNAKAAMCKLYASEMLGRVADRAVQIYGGMGYMRETVVERMYRNARVERIWEGTSEIQRVIIAKNLLKRNLYF